LSGGKSPITYGTNGVTTSPWRTFHGVSSYSPQGIPLILVYPAPVLRLGFNFPPFTYMVHPPPAGMARTPVSDTPPFLRLEFPLSPLPRPTSCPLPIRPPPHKFAILIRFAARFVCPLFPGETSWFPPPIETFLFNFLLLWKGDQVLPVSLMVLIGKGFLYPQI